MSFVVVGLMRGERGVGSGEGVGGVVWGIVGEDGAGIGRGLRTVGMRSLEGVGWTFKLRGCVERVAAREREGGGEVERRGCCGLGSESIAGHDEQGDVRVGPV